MPPRQGTISAAKASVLCSFLGLGSFWCNVHEIYWRNMYFSTDEGWAYGWGYYEEQRNWREAQIVMVDYLFPVS